MLNLDEWHARYTQQAAWTADIRKYLFHQAGLTSETRVLEVGCGTGAILKDTDFTIQTYGLDIEFERVKYASHILPNPSFVCGDAYQLPYPTDHFDVVFSHFLFLWLKRPEKALKEMMRVTRPDGMVVAIAEPDYGGRIDYPSKLAKIGAYQAEALEEQGADTHAGRKLAGLFSSAGLLNIETGVLQGHWSQPPSKNDWELEWKVLEDDLINDHQINEIQTLKDYDWESWQNRSRVMFIPTFYAIGKCPLTQ